MKNKRGNIKKAFLKSIFLMILICSVTSLSAADSKPRLPITYSKFYDITLFGLEKMHPFDSAKYSKVYNYLIDKGLITEKGIYNPGIAGKNDLLSMHTEKYLESLNSSKVIAQIAELPTLSFIPDFILQDRILKPMKYAVGGTILGVELALKYGWAINLSGGYHHAKADSGSGFCYFADVAIAVKKAWLNNEKLKVLIVDLDAHQGNGNESIFKDDKRINIFDVYNFKNFPGDDTVKSSITFNYPVKPLIEDGDYLLIIENQLPFAIEVSKPDLIIYNAGTDVLSEDYVGGLSLSDEGIIKRDELVFENALKYKVPILMVLSGGYTSRSAGVIGKSIENLLVNVIKNSY